MTNRYQVVLEPTSPLLYLYLLAVFINDRLAKIEDAYLSFPFSYHHEKYFLTLKGDSCWNEPSFCVVVLIYQKHKVITMGTWVGKR